MSQDQIDEAVKASGPAGGNGRPALELSEYDDAAVVRVRGRVDATLTRNLRDCLTWAVTQHGTVLVDLSAVEGADRFGLGALARAHHRAIALGTAFCLVAPSGAVRAALRAARLDDVFVVFNTLADAFAGVERRLVPLHG